MRVIYRDTGSDDGRQAVYAHLEFFHGDAEADEVFAQGVDSSQLAGCGAMKKALTIVWSGT